MNLNMLSLFLGGGGERSAKTSVSPSLPPRGRPPLSSRSMSANSGGAGVSLEPSALYRGSTGAELSCCDNRSSSSQARWLAVSSGSSFSRFRRSMRKAMDCGLPYTCTKDEACVSGTGTVTGRQRRVARRGGRPGVTTAGTQHHPGAWRPIIGNRRLGTTPPPTTSAGAQGLSRRRPASLSFPTTGAASRAVLIWGRDTIGLFMTAAKAS